MGRMIGLFAFVILLVVCLVGFSVLFLGLLVGWFVWLVGCFGFVCWLVGWFVRLATWLVGWSFGGCLVDWLWLFVAWAVG